VFSVFAVILGSTGDERFAVLLQRNGINGVEGDERIRFKESDQVAGWLLDAQCNLGLRVLFAQFSQPGG